MHETEDKQKLFRLIKKVSSEPTGHSAQDMRPSPRQTGSSARELSAAAVKARQLDGNLALLDLDEQDDDVLVKVGQCLCLAWEGQRCKLEETDLTTTLVV